MFPHASGLPRSLASRWGVSRQLTVWLLRHVRAYDVVHVDFVWAWSTISAALAGSIARRPVVMTAHESLTNYGIRTRSGSDNHGAWLWSLAKRSVRRILMRHVALIVMTSDMEYTDSVRASERAVVIPHAVVDEPPPEPPVEPPLSPFTVGYIGRLHPKKNIDVLLRAIANLGIPVHLIVCGDGDPAYRTQLHDLAEQLCVSDRVEWRGHVDPTGRASLFAASHVIAMPSTYECFGMAAAEAMAAGVPVIVSKTTGVAPIVEKHDCGKLVEAGRVDQLCAALADIVGDAAWRRRARLNSLRAVSATYSYDSYGSQIGAAYAGFG